MTQKIRLVPFDVPGATSSSLSAGPWHWNGHALENPAYLKAWGYATPLVFRRTLQLDDSQFREDTGLPVGARLLVAVAWEVRSGLPLGGVAARKTVELLEKGLRDVGLSIEVSSPDLAQELTLCTRIVLGQPTAGAGSRYSATEPGSVLWSDDVQVVLEGGSSRLPVALADFSRFGEAERNASWYLWTAPGWLHGHPSAGLTVYLNAARPKLQERLAAGGTDDASAMLRSVFRHEVGRTMLERALEDEEFRDDADFPVSSAGASIRRTLALLFPGQRISDVRTLRRLEPDAFERILQVRHKHLEAL